MLDWEDVRYFLALAEGGTLAATARALQVDHATVGRRVAELEKALGATLVERRSKGYRLTRIGQQIADLGQAMRIQADTLERAARALHVPLSGTVKVSAPPGLASHFLACRLAVLRRSHPDLHLVLIGDSMTASLSRQETDIAIRLSRPTEASSFMRRVGTMTFWLYGTPDYVRTRSSAEWEFIAYDASLDRLPQQDWLKRFAGDRPIVFRTNDLAIQLGAARGGTGIAALPCFMGDDDPGLAPLPVQWEPFEREIWLVVHSDLRHLPVLRVVLDLVTRLLGELRPPRWQGGES